MVLKMATSACCRGQFAPGPTLSVAKRKRALHCCCPSIEVHINTLGVDNPSSFWAALQGETLPDGLDGARRAPQISHGGKEVTELRQLGTGQSA